MPDNLLQFPAATSEAAANPGAPFVSPSLGDMSGPPPPPATRTLPPDHAARAEALNIRASFIVEAPAGSGKTGLLMQRFLKLLAYAEIDEPEEVLAITFTRKATAELRERIVHQLQQAAASPGTEPGAPFMAPPSGDMSGPPQTPEAPPTPAFAQQTQTLAAAVLLRDRERSWGLLANPNRLHIRTIDSVASEIASTLPLLAGSAAGRTPSDDPNQLYNLAAERTLMQLGGPDARLDSALHTVLRHRDASLSDVRSLLASMLGKREQWGELVPLGNQLDDATLDNEVRPRLERALESIVCAGLNRATKAIPPDMLQGLGWLAARLAHEPGYKSEPSPIQICANKTEPPEDRAEHLDHWIALIGLVLTTGGEWRSGFNVNHVGLALPSLEKALLKQMIDEVRHDDALREALQAVRCLPPSRYPDTQWHVAKALFHLLLRALAELKVLFTEREQCDFAELTLAAREALENADGPADLARTSGFTLRHLLVDEMQDTSTSQYELIQLLSQSWDGHSQTLFLVGDPKQSIYLFRQARVERFLRAVREERLGDIPLQPLSLSSNFRSQAILVKEFNDDFIQVFPQVIHSPQTVPFVAAEPTRPPEPDLCGRVWHTCVKQESTHLDTGDITGPTGIDDLRHREDEAHQIRRIVDHWRAQPLPPGREKPWSIAVLARTREHLTHVIREFHQPGTDGLPIPFAAVEIEKLGEQPEVLDLLALTRALLHPADRIAWLAILHGPWCGLDLADLLAIAGNGAPETQHEAIPATAPARRHLLSATGAALFDRAWPILERALDTRGRTSMADEVERTWRSLGGDAALDSRQLANAQIFLAALRKAEEPGGRLHLDRFTAAVGRLYAEPQTDPGAVTLSTIHKAKGLEWDVVLIPGLERPARGNTNDLLNWLELDAAGNESAQVILAPIAGKGDDPDALYKWLNSVRAARDAAERKRLFYVGCTRAREKLHLFAAATRKKSTGELCPPAGTLLQASWEAAQPHFMQNERSSLHTLAIKDLLLSSLREEGPLSLAASSDQPTQKTSSSTSTPPLIHRLPLSFRPLASVSAPLPPRPGPGILPQAAVDRPEGSFAVRAFGNVVHRFLQRMAGHLETSTPAILADQLPDWLPRLTASLRAEGLPQTVVPRLAERALHALTAAVTDPTGLWILSPHPGSRSEAALRVLSSNAPAARELRIDRTFLAGASPGSAGESHLWIVDFKTTAQGSHSDSAFEAAERAKYTAQLAAYAAAFRNLPGTPTHIQLALYYPLLPRLISWPAPAATAFVV